MQGRQRLSGLRLLPQDARQLGVNMTDKFDYVIIGGGLAGGNAASSIRESDATGSILLIAGESHLPYDRVPLSKNFLYGRMPRDALYFKKQENYDLHKIKIISGKSVTSLDAKNKEITLDDKSLIQFGKLLLATGGAVRHIDIPGSGLKNVHYLRTIEDGEKVRQAMQTAKNAVVIGGGFIGCELASSFARQGITATIIEAGDKILGRVFDKETANWVQNYFEKKGVKVLTSTIPERFVEKDGRVVAVETRSGNRVEADFVVVGIGVSPNIELAKSAGLRTENGIWCDEHLQTSSPNIYAAGDVACFYSPVFRKQLRLEHYDLAIKQGRTAGANMAGRLEPFMEIPYFFSFMFDIRIEVYGDMGSYDRIIVRGRQDEGRFVKMYLQDGTVNAVMVVNCREDVNSIKKLITSRARFENLSVLGNESKKISEMIAA